MVRQAPRAQFTMHPNLVPSREHPQEGGRHRLVKLPAADPLRCRMEFAEQLEVSYPLRPIQRQLRPRHRDAGLRGVIAPGGGGRNAPENKQKHSAATSDTCGPRAMYPPPPHRPAPSVAPHRRGQATLALRRRRVGFAPPFFRHFSLQPLQEEQH